MAKYVVPPKKPKNVILLKCYSCGTLYSPERIDRTYLTSGSYEKCPECGYTHNSDGQRIPLWKYNLIAWWRGYDKSEEHNCSEITESSQEELYEVVKKMVEQIWEDGF